MFRQPRLRKIALICLLAAGFIVLTLSALQAEPSRAQECTPPECYPPEDPPPEGGGGGGPGDNRLNWAPDEYYSIYCKFDLIEVWGGVPIPQNVNNIPIIDVLTLGDIGSFDGGNGLTVSRSGDIVTISGSNGNGPNHPGSKWFSLTDCINANGGAPLPSAEEVEFPEEPPVGESAPPQEESVEPPAGEEDALGNVWLCLPGTTSMADFLDCLNFFAPDNPTSEYYYVLNWAIATFCAGGFPVALIAGLPAIRLWRRRKKQD